MKNTTKKDYSISVCNFVLNLKGGNEHEIDGKNLE
ncbi:hypothetical protein CLJU_c12760 [Clostridium ljungdahlii DSM 13528]|uniref:Uncharacterized protein n=1 Tax=Clostridium ljungdahlii (strain ATCC 55383 / DSM 13528 / PETC) TaxID=748727 RepID=D8GRZ1_CLOLD|nr:hypothetical protein CLJU_c12760 [Clostridium ljungdahlii DSM 13528]